MPKYACTFFFESEQSASLGAGSAVGWTETWYKTADIGIEAALMDEDLNKYILLRRLCMPGIYRISFVRVSDMELAHRFKIRTIPAANGGIAGVPAQVQCALLVDLERLPVDTASTEKVHHRRFLMRGLAAAFINGNVLADDAAGFANVNTFLDFIGRHQAGEAVDGRRSTFSWGIRFEDHTIPAVAILTLDVTEFSDNKIAVTPVVPALTPRKTHYILNGIDSPPGMNRVWTYLGDHVQNLVPTSVFGTSRRKIQGIYRGPGAGQYRKVSYLTGPVSQYAIIGLRNKKTGRVFRQLRGRSSGR